MPVSTILIVYNGSSNLLNGCTPRIIALHGDIPGLQYSTISPLFGKRLLFDVFDVDVDKSNLGTKPSSLIGNKTALSVRFGGSGGGSFFGSLFGRASGGSVQKGQPYMVGEQGAELFVPNQSGQIQQSARGGNGGATTVNFNINTVDASGFEELLIRSRGTITQLINNAVNERGSRNII